MKRFYTLFALFLSISFTTQATTHNVGLGGPNGNTFNPANLMVNAGDTVVWINQGGFHNVNGSTSTFPSNPASFGNGTASASWAYSFVFSIPGTYSYQCDPHAGLGMSGTVTVNAAPAPAALNPGDIVFAGFQADAPDGFAIIPMVDLPGNLDISFTDRSWGPSSTNGGTFDWYSTTGEDTMTWTTPAGGVSAGTYIRFEDPSSGSDALIFGAGGTTVGSLGGISGSGDNIFCYLGSIPNPSFVAGIMTPRSNNINLTWLTSGLAASTESYLPPSLTDGFSAFVMASAHVDNGYYDCSLSVGDTVTLRSNIYNAGNWVTDDDVNIAGSANWPACNLTFGSAPTTSTVSFSTSSQSISESVGSLALTLQFSPTTTADDTVIVTLTPGIGLDPTDGSTAPAFDLITGEILIPVTAGTDSAQIILTVVDDAIVESSETGTFDITYVSGGLAAGSNTSVAITILDNDQVIPTYSIGDVTSNAADGSVDSALVYCAVEGIVLGVNMNANGAQFTVNDGSDGIGVYSPVALPGFTVNEGDEVRIIGSIDQFNGLTQIYADSAKVLSQGNPIPSPVVVAALGESTESELVEIQDLSLVDSSQWSGSGSGFNVDVTDGINTYTVRIDNDVDLYSMPAPSGTFHVRGIGGQFDSSSPFDSGYQLLPRYSADVIPAIGLNEFEKSIIAFPNPFTSSLKLNVDQTTEVRIWNTLGALVWSGEINGEVRVRTESWESGLYLIEFTSQNGSETHRVIKR
ncbi:MAG: T9SS type A sorting domain-containing protein [Flavobacteriales bacterium]|nr:T9SS type A sorting domain-containing protein [Flavobacteriales bacterium]